MMERGHEIVCALCRKANADFDAINRKINQAKTPAEKAPHARELIEKVEAVFKEHNASGNLLTEACRTLLSLRKQTAELILKFLK